LYTLTGQLSSFLFCIYLLFCWYFLAWRFFLSVNGMLERFEVTFTFGDRKKTFRAENVS
jgi:hypothetical protein